MLSGTYLFLTCVKNNAINLVNEFMDDEDRFLSNRPKVFLGAIYICLMHGHTAILRNLISNGPINILKHHMIHFQYAIDVALAKGHYDTVIWFLEYAKI